MAGIKVVGGDYKKGKGKYHNNHFILSTGFFGEEKISIRKVQKIEKIKKGSKLNLPFSAGGFLLFGPVGIVAGLLGEEQVTFLVEFENGKKLVASAGKKTFREMQNGV